MVHRYVVSKEKVDVAARIIRQLCCNAIVEMFFMRLLASYTGCRLGLVARRFWRRATPSSRKRKVQFAKLKLGLFATFYIQYCTEAVQKVAVQDNNAVRSRIRGVRRIPVPAQ